MKLLLKISLVYAGIAQLAVHLTCNEKVGGSSPSTGSRVLYEGVVSNIMSYESKNCGEEINALCHLACVKPV